MIRQHANLTRAEVARAVGVDPSTVSRWESGERRPRGAAAARYADLLRRLSPSGPHSPAGDLEPVLCPPITLADIRHLAVIRVWPDTAELLGISKASAYRAAENGTIPTLKVGRRLLVPVPQLLHLLGETTTATDSEAV